MLLLQVALYAALELWPSSVHDFQHRATGGASYAIQSEVVGIRAFGAFDLLHTDLTKKTVLSILNAESGMVLTKTHGVEVFVLIGDVEAGIRQEKVSAVKFPTRYESWYGSTWREGDPSVGYYSGFRPYIRGPSWSISGPLVPLTATLPRPIIKARVSAGLGFARLTGEYRGPYVGDWKVPSDFDVTIQRGVFFIRAGRVHIPLALKPKKIRRIAAGIMLRLSS